MSNCAAHLVDRILPDVPVRQYVLSLPFELRRLAAFKADVLTALARIFVEATSATYRARAKHAGIEGAQCGSVLCVQRFGSLNLNVHFHTLVLDGVFTRDPQSRVLFHPAPPAGPGARRHRRDRPSELKEHLAPRTALRLPTICPPVGPAVSLIWATVLGVPIT